MYLYLFINGWEFLLFHVKLHLIILRHTASGKMFKIKVNTSEKIKVIVIKLYFEEMFNRLAQL